MIHAHIIYALYVGAASNLLTPTPCVLICCETLLAGFRTQRMLEEAVGSPVAVHANPSSVNEVKLAKTTNPDLAISFLKVYCSLVESSYFLTCFR